MKVSSIKMKDLIMLKISIITYCCVLFVRLCTLENCNRVISCLNIETISSEDISRESHI